MLAVLHIGIAFSFPTIWCIQMEFVTCFKLLNLKITNLILPIMPLILNKAFFSNYNNI